MLPVDNVTTKNKILTELIHNIFIHLGNKLTLETEFKWTLKTNDLESQGNFITTLLSLSDVLLLYWSLKH